MEGSKLDCSAEWDLDGFDGSGRRGAIGGAVVGQCLGGRAGAGGGRGVSSLGGSSTSFHSPEAEVECPSNRHQRRRV